jgi:hypothetical protein
VGSSLLEIYFLTLLVFLANEKKENGPASEFYYFPNYPMPKMADFGLAKLTTYGDNDNSPGPFKQGTRPYYAPVRTHLSMW